MKSKKPYPSGIIRIEQPSFSGFRVTLKYADYVFRKAVAIKADGEHAAYLQAEKILQRQLMTNPPKLKPFFEKPGAANTSGFNGLSETIANGKRCINVFYRITPNQDTQERFYFDDFANDSECWDAAKSARLTAENFIVGYRKAKKIYPFDGSIDFCLIRECIWRAPLGFKYCAHHFDYSEMIDLL